MMLLVYIYIEYFTSFNASNGYLLPKFGVKISLF